MSDRAITGSVPLPDVGSYHDLRSLNQLRQLGAKDEQAALKAAAKQFESVFLQELLKSMRAANEVFEDDDFFGGGGASEFYEQMHDEQLALSLANQQQLGLADVMVQQLSRSAVRQPKSGTPALAPSLTPPSRPAEHTLPLPPRPPVTPAALHTSPRASGDVGSTLPVSAPAAPALPKQPLDFVRDVLPHAERAGNALGVDPVLLVAQAALETGWGRALPTTASGKALSPVAGKELPVPGPVSSHHYFGIKADARWQGKTISSPTLEYVDGVPQRQRAQFRAYESVAESFDDYTRFIQSSPRYAGALKQPDNPVAYAEGLQQGGYATDPAYANKLLRVFNSEQLRELINEARKLL